jgi:hypothetical protein
MLAIAINKIYDKFLKITKQGEEFSVPVTNLDKDEVFEVKVWAKNPEHAEQRAIYFAEISEQTDNLQFDKSLGLIRGKEFYTPKSTGQAVSSPIAVWRDPVYKEAMQQISNNAGFKTGSMLKGAMAELKDVTAKKQIDGVLTLPDLNKYLKNNIISMFSWSAFIPAGSLFLYAGLTTDNFDGRLTNQPLIAGIVLLIIGATALTASVKDYRVIQKKIMELENGL